MAMKNKGASKRCCYCTCKNDSHRISPKDEQSFVFIKFAKPCISYRHKLINCVKESISIFVLSVKKSEQWVKYCRRADEGLRTIENVTKDAYICSLHFYNKTGPTNAYPNPIDHMKSAVNPVKVSFVK